MHKKTNLTFEQQILLHDINNQLMLLQLNLDQLARKPELGPLVVEIISSAVDGSAAITALVRKIPYAG